MIFPEWVRSEFGPRGIAEAARFLGKPYQTVHSWFSYDRFPMIEEQSVIELKSKGKVSIRDWREKYISEKQRRKNKRVKA